MSLMAEFIPISNGRGMPDAIPLRRNVLTGTWGGRSSYRTIATRNAVIGMAGLAVAGLGARAVGGIVGEKIANAIPDRIGAIRSRKRGGRGASDASRA